MLASQRGFLFLLFAGLSYYLYLTWDQDQAAKLAAANAPVIQQQSVLDTPVALPSDAPVATSASDVPTAAVVADAPAPVTDASRYIELKNDTLRVVIDRIGGDVVEADLLRYPQSLDAGAAPIRLLQQNAQRVYIAQSGLTGEGAPDSAAQRATWTVQEKNADTVLLSWTNSAGVRFSKQLALQNGSHKLQVRYVVDNASSAAFAGRLYGQFKRDRHADSGGPMGLSTYTGAAYGTAEKRYEKYTFDKISEEPLAEKSARGWVAMLQHYFVAAWVPDQNQAVDISTAVAADQNVLVRVLPAAFTVQPGTQAEQVATLYLGPKLQDDLAAIAPGLDLTVDYGFLWWIGQPLFWLMVFFHKVIGNWGVAIILVTVAVKVLMYPIANAQFRSFAKMRQIQPKLAALKERHGDDRQAFSAAMMELYKKEKVNPLGGCLPLLLTFPVFMALYWVLMESVELRHSAFAFWITDLAVMDPFFVLPVLVGASMWFMQKLQPPSPTMDPMQQKMFQYMPVMMSVFFLWMPAGLNLYWLVNNLLTIAQQVFINKRMDAEALKKS